MRGIKGWDRGIHGWAGWVQGWGRGIQGWGGVGGVDPWWGQVDPGLGEDQGWIQRIEVNGVDLGVELRRTHSSRVGLMRIHDLGQ